MKTFRLNCILSLVMLLVMAIPSFAKSSENGTAKIKFTEKTYNFGTIKEDGGSVSCEFEFTNSGDANLVILDATAQCGCTRPEYPKNPVAPGKKGKIKVTYNPIGRPGAFEKVVTVKSNAKSAKVRLKISGTVTPKK